MHIMKRLNLKKTFLYSLIACLSMASCGDYFDLSENPNLVNKPPLGSLLTTATHRSALNSYNIAYNTSNYVQYTASPTTASATDTYDVTNPNSSWDALQFTLATLYDLTHAAEEEKAQHYLGIAQILTAYNLGLLADHWGAAPYSDAYSLQNLTPKYDTEESLYSTQLSLLKSGLAHLAEASTVKVLASADLIHAGELEAWTKTGNALLARALNKVSKKSSYDATQVLSALEKSYTSNADDAQMGVFKGINPWAAVALDNENLNLDGWLSSQFINQLNGTTFGLFDPRIEQITDKTVHGVYVGTRNGQGNTGAANTIKDECYISRNAPLTSDKAALTLVSYAETKMIEAEAALRAGKQSQAYQAYLAGINAHMQKLSVAADKQNLYVNNALVSVGENQLSLNQIFKEKFVITYLNAEAWNDARRFDYQYQGFQMPLNAVLKTFIRRIAYPSGERSKNFQNVPAEVALDTKLWWDQP